MSRDRMLKMILYRGLIGKKKKEGKKDGKTVGWKYQNRRVEDPVRNFKEKQEQGWN